MVHRFHECLARGEQQSEEPFWTAVYEAAIPGFVCAVRNDADNAAQRLGIDRLILTSSGATLKADEKRRGHDRMGDVLLEVGHVYDDGRNEASGWINKDLQIDLLVYGWVPAQQAIVFPWPLLRRAWLAKRDQWALFARRREFGFSRVEAKNCGYRTINYAIPTDVLVGACADAMRVNVAQRRAA